MALLSELKIEAGESEKQAKKHRRRGHRETDGQEGRGAAGGGEDVSLYQAGIR